MEKVNRKFIKVCDQRIKEKEPEYGGKNNPLNYRNIGEGKLVELIYWDTFILKHETHNVGFKQKLCIDIANRCSMLWEKLEEE